MDKKTILAFVLIGFILILTQSKFYKNLVLPKKQNVVTHTEVDSSIADKKIEKIEKTTINNAIEEKKDQRLENPKPKSLFSTNENENLQDVVVETDRYIAHLNPKGATISKWIMKDYDYNNGPEKVQLIQNEGYGNLGIFFTSNDDTIYTYDSVFSPDKEKINFGEGHEADSIKFTLTINKNKKLVKTFIFHRDKYLIDLKVDLINIISEFDGNQYYLSWESGLDYAEVDYSDHISVEDVNNSKAYVYQGGSKEELNLSNKPSEKQTRSDFSGVVDWVAIRNKYFAMILLPKKEYDIEPTISGKTYPLYKDEKYKDRVNKVFSATLKSKLPPSNINEVSQEFRIYLGPLDYNLIKKYDPTLERLMDFGMSLIRPFAKGVLFVFIFLHSFIPNYGVVLIVFSILVKILVYPLTKKSYVSMQKMQTLQPKLNELKEKYGKDPQRMNKETMKLYKEHGANPVSGCLPTLLQMPLLFAIFIVFRNTIELRDAGFIWWINDLSAPDTIFQLPFAIPFYGNLVNVLPIVMGITMLIQQKMTMKDPKQKAMVYFMPIFLTLLFNSFPSGLNLYYALFNILTIAQQKLISDKGDGQSEQNITQSNVGQSTQTKKKVSKRK